MRSLALGFALSIGLCSTGCTQKQNQVTAPPQPAAKRAERIVVGLGTSCTKDANCGPVGSRGACIMTTCFGLLTTENPAAQMTLLERLRVADPQVQAVAGRLLIQVASSNQSDRTGRIAAVRGLGTLLKRDVCNEACRSLRTIARSEDARLALLARLALSRRLDDTIIDDLMVDLERGTEQLRCAVARRMANYKQPKIQSALKQVTGLNCLLPPGANEAPIAP
ncbi:MAG TPA: hypothetical protein DCQ06_14420 [Myxococcales bacterium]|nr:hypothetical protein [Myxococcales bacterium]HAN32785.1 hypothetical protein [Myxococcales bacterium]